MAQAGLSAVRGGSAAVAFAALRRAKLDRLEHNPVEIWELVPLAEPDRQAFQYLRLGADEAERMTGGVGVDAPAPR